MSGLEIPEWLDNRKLKPSVVQHDNGDIQIEYGHGNTINSEWFEDPDKAINWLIDYFKRKKTYAISQRQEEVQNQ